MGNCADIFSSRSKLNQVGDGLFFSQNSQFCSRRKYVNTRTLMVSTRRAAILLVET